MSIGAGGGAQTAGVAIDAEGDGHREVAGQREGGATGRERALRSRRARGTRRGCLADGAIAGRRWRDRRGWPVTDPGRAAGDREDGPENAEERPRPRPRSAHRAEPTPRPSRLRGPVATDPPVGRWPLLASRACCLASSWRRSCAPRRRRGGSFSELFVEERTSTSIRLDDGKVEELTSGLGPRGGRARRPRHVLRLRVLEPARSRLPPAGGGGRERRAPGGRGRLGRRPDRARGPRREPDGPPGGRAPGRRRRSPGSGSSTTPLGA